MSTKGKKKPPVALEKQPPVNKIYVIKTKDGKEYKILQSLLSKYSQLCKGLIEQDKSQQGLSLPDVDSESFDYMYEFMQLHKDKQPIKLALPLRSNQSLRHVMEEGDAQLIERIVSKGDLVVKNALDASSFLEMEDMKKRIIAGIALKLIGFTVEEMKKEYGIEDEELNQDQLRGEIKNQVSILSKMEDE